MAASTGIVLTAASIAFANEWYQSGTIPWRVAVGGALLTALEAGIEKISEPLALGLGTIMLITVLVTPFHGKSPLQEVSNVINGTKRVP